ncbi:unnamed protein product [Adineta steineri]|uniref:NHL repeat containing protein n=1 Tax=Adineta steineri TaxID=433720 RepID=A0A819MJ83_9BILA|nr:unnamed protein product [Adineta steineri]CAF1057279.1 unnamed protein product [Adineta steineri]CAF3844864.1 unnamed protein product [Adineta steineri]CAF3981435.1 unnamed protein product [Adineta steineri]
MFFTSEYKSRQLVTFIWSLFFLALMVHPIYSEEIFQSRIVYYPIGTQYSPVNQAAQLLSTTITNSLKACAIACNQNVLCRIIEYDISASEQCRLFEGDIDTTGSIITLPSQSRVGVVQISASLFSQHGFSCGTSCQENRYLTCQNDSTCQCMPHTYWNKTASICMPQSSLIGAPCQQNMSMCREDFGYNCLPTNQCGYATIETTTSVVSINLVTSMRSSTLAVTTESNTNAAYEITSTAPSTSIQTSISMTSANHVTTDVSSASPTTKQSTEISTDTITSTSSTAELRIGITVAGYDNMSATGDAFGLNVPRGIYVSPPNETLYVCDSNNFRVQRFYFGSRVGVTVAGGFGSPQRNIIMNRVWNVVVDNSENVYVADRNLYRATRWPPNITVGVTQGAIISTGVGIWGIAFDQHGNLYTALFDTHVIVLNNVTIIGGQYNISGNSSTKLNNPRGIFFDNNSSSLFVCDSANHRIQRFRINSTVGVTVAGGNGPGSDSNQLNYPNAVWVSSKTGFMYIADSNNNRIQRWKINDTQAVTVAGAGIAGNLSTMFNSPVGVALNANETFLYVSDQNNNRIQRFDLTV